MIYLNLQITNPWGTFFKIGKVWSGKLFQHKFWELQAMRTHDIVMLKFELSTRRDHSGLAAEIGLLSFNVSFTVYDNRHWDYEKNTWQVSNKN